MISSHCKLLFVSDGGERCRKVGTIRLLGSALGGSKKKGNYLQAQFHRLKAQRGPKKAIMAVVASI